VASTSLTGGQILAFTNEIVGFKSGLALSRDQMLGLLPSDSNSIRLLQVPEETFVRLRIEELEALTTGLLYELGVIDTPEYGLPLLFGHYLHDPERAPIAAEVIQMWTAHLSREIDAILAGRTERSIDPTPFLNDALEKFGPLGAEIAMETVQRMIDYEKRSPWTEMRVVEWKDVQQLDELFESENLSTGHGKYFDQRFINYLDKQFGDLAKIHWRKFEGLAAEFLDRSGFSIEIGAGRNDGSIDIRAWTRTESNEMPPTLLVQCKREKKKVGKVVVKALWADVHNEGAESGLIVTSTSLSPGAKTVCQSRGYPIYAADRDTLKRWIHAMRTPGSGLFLGE
jgi:restriction system protein